MIFGQGLGGICIPVPAIPVKREPGRKAQKRSCHCSVFLCPAHRVRKTCIAVVPVQGKTTCHGKSITQGKLQLKLGTSATSVYIVKQEALSLKPIVQSPVVSLNLEAATSHSKVFSQLQKAFVVKKSIFSLFQSVASHRFVAKVQKKTLGIQGKNGKIRIQGQGPGRLNKAFHKELLCFLGRGHFHHRGRQLWHRFCVHHLQIWFQHWWCHPYRRWCWKLKLIIGQGFL